MHEALAESVGAQTYHYAGGDGRADVDEEAKDCADLHGRGLDSIVCMRYG